MRKKVRLKKTNCLILLLIISAFLCTTSYSRYLTNVKTASEIKVAKFGEMTLVEKLNGVIQSNNKKDSELVDYEIIAGENIDKEVYIQFTSSEISAYLFLVIEGTKWSYDDEISQFSVINNGAKLLSFNIDENWNYLESYSSDNKFVFYYLVDVNNNILTKFNVMNGIYVGVITESDMDSVNQSEIKFNAYAIQKNQDLTVEETWDYLNRE